MKNILFYGGASLLSSMWINYWHSRYNLFLGLNNRWIEYDFAKSIRISNDMSKIEDTLYNNKIDVIINCAGITNVEECENNPELAIKINTILPGNLANICNNLGIKFVHISTDHLFNGNKMKINESEKPNPLNVYGKTKAAGDLQVMKKNNKALIIRSNFFGNGPYYKGSFSDRIINSLKNHQEINLFNNVFYTPIHIYELADSVEDLINLDADEIYNVCSNERITKYDFGIMIAKTLKLKDKLIIPTNIEENKNLVLRPKDMSLSNKKLKEFTGRRIKPIIDQINFLLK